VPRSPLLTRVVAACHTAAHAARTGAFPSDLLAADATGPNDHNAITRHFVGAAAAGAVGALAACAGPERTLLPITGDPNATKTSAPDRVVVVGAGLAGLTCAYRLLQRGVDVTVYEGNTRVGGRCWTNRTAFDGGQLAEHGGELIDQSHTTIRQLAQELGLPLDNVLAAEPNGTEPFFWFDGGRYPVADAVRDLKAV